MYWILSFIVDFPPDNALRSKLSPDTLLRSKLSAGHSKVNCPPTLKQNVPLQGGQFTSSGVTSIRSKLS